MAGITKEYFAQLVSALFVPFPILPSCFFFHSGLALLFSLHFLPTKQRHGQMGHTF